MKKTHRVGSITFGIILIALGISLLLHSLFPALSYTLILSFWPVILVLLGIEVLIGTIRSEKVHFQYDGWSILLLFMVLLFTCCMGVLDWTFTHYPEQYLCL